MQSAIDNTFGELEQYSSQGRRTLVLCFYAGHGVTYYSKTYALLNSNKRGNTTGGNQYPLEVMLGESAREGAYVISLIACDRVPMPKEAKAEEEESKRGGTEATEPRPIQDDGQGIMIHAVPYNN